MGVDDYCYSNNVLHTFSRYTHTYTHSLLFFVEYISSRKHFKFFVSTRHILFNYCVPLDTPKLSRLSLIEMYISWCLVMLYLLSKVYCPLCGIRNTRSTTTYSLILIVVVIIVVWRCRCHHRCLYCCFYRRGTWQHCTLFTLSSLSVSLALLPSVRLSGAWVCLFQFISYGKNVTINQRFTWCHWLHVRCTLCDRDYTFAFAYLYRTVWLLGNAFHIIHRNRKSLLALGIWVM